MFLGIDTTADSFSVALGPQKGQFAEKNIPGRRHSETLIPTVDLLFRELAVSKNQIKAIGMGVGPGSFTGIRVGLSFGISFAQIMKIPAYGFSSMDLAGKKEHEIILKAYRDRYYYASYDGTGRRKGGFKIITRSQSEYKNAVKLKISAAKIVSETKRLYKEGRSGKWTDIKPVYIMETVYRKKEDKL